MSNKVSKSFQDTIKAYLDARAQTDELFAISYAKEGKSIEECCNFICQEVKKMKVQGLADEEVYSLAVHYYDEDDLGTITGAGCNVVVNHTVELTEAEKEQARRDAIAQYQKEELQKLHEAEKKKEEKAKKKPALKAAAPVPNSPSLFEFGDDEAQE